MIFFFLTAGISFGISFAAKLLADQFLDERIAIWGQFVGLYYSHNPGIAFGIRLPNVLQEVFIGLALLLVIWLALKSAKTMLSQIGYGLIVGGALGNVIDRMRDGFVTDFFQVGTFPIFNVADSCITVGVVLLLADMAFLSRNRKH